MKYFLDAEFHEYQKQPKVLGLNVGKPINTIELISIGIVSETYNVHTNKKYPGTENKEYYAICKDFDLKAAWNNEWLRENVLTGIWKTLAYKEYDGKINYTTDGGLIIFFEDGTKTVVKAYKSFKMLINKYGKTKKQIATEIYDFVSESTYVKDGFEASENENLNPEFYAYYADYDWVVFCQLWSALYPVQPKSFETGMSYMNPKGFPYYCKDLKQMLDEEAISTYCNNGTLDSEKDINRRIEHLKAHPDYPKQSNEHNALADAKWNKELYKFLNTL